MAQTTLNVKGMTSENCIKEVEATLANIVGVERALADLDNGKVHLEYDADKVNEKQIEQVIKNSGYAVF
jgi:copper chaperone CopZ